MKGQSQNLDYLFAPAKSILTEKLWCLKLKDYFYERSQTDETFNNGKKKLSNTEKERFPPNWNIKNSHKDFSEHIHSKRTNIGIS